ncbi:MAG: N-6 DNA methylase, partial [Ignavibacteriaceae bacterium]|nr:N-6 DNA methylase [Ignavibacteriaceae bacterium]
MSLFQNTVLNKYLGNLDPHLTEEKYKLFTSYFNNPEIRTNILNSKEEQFQEGFLISLFVNILGYTINPNPGFNLITEFKNEKDSRKSDAAIIINNTVIGIIELKGTEIIDLTKIENQAFGYKNNHPEAVYVITSNFRKIRLYIDNAVNFNEFDLFNLTFDEFKILCISLSFSAISGGIPLKIKQESLVREENISRQLYNDYSFFKRNLFNNLITLNPQIDQLTLFKKTQKLLDRFLFIFFAEDRMLLPANSMRNILSQWTQLKDLDQYVPLYDRIKKFFSYLNTGYKSNNLDIFPYNGGLFRPDDVLDNILIDDDILKSSSTTLSNYDFNTEIDVNILGHIFENSLNEIEEITLSIQGKEIDKSKTKRKKEGVFYTPKYITSYIVKNTLGSLCNEIKNELGIIEEDYSPENKSKDTRRKLVNTLDAYRERLLKITICDPACGSGAFLNQALDYLINEHKYIDELKAKLLGESLILSDIENSILENNLFGVDINEESVEIAKLSLWLRTARKNRKLNNLSDNIKCGNSLIDDPAIAGEKAFNWHKEFPQVFAKGGFDIIIGNPPYVRQELLGNYKEYFSKNYRVFNYSSDLFAYFYEKAFLLLKQKGLLGFISNTFDKTTAGSDLRAFLQNNIKVEKYVDFTEVQIFEGATTYPIILIASNYFIEDNSFLFIKIPKNTSPSLIDIYHLPSVTVMQQSLNSSNWTFHSIGSNALLNKINLHENIRTQYGKCFRGIVTGFNLAFIISKSEKDSILMESPADEEIIKPFYEGKDLSKWYSPD